MNLLSDLVMRIKVANTAKILKINVINSKLCLNILKVMYKLGYIRGFIVIDSKTITVLLKYINNKPVIKNIYVISTPGRRVYLKSKELKRQIDKKDSGFYIISTSKGLMTDEEVLLFNIGGEALIKIS
jgi:small subunit ribosomal protein S8